MQSYKIRISDPETSRRVQEKAFSLGHQWASEDQIIRFTDNPVLVISESWGIYAPSLRNYNNCNHPEISWQDFLAIGEEKKIDIRNCKIDLSSLRTYQDYERFSNKLDDLEIFGYSNGSAVRPPVIRGMHYHVDSDERYGFYWSEVNGWYNTGDVPLFMYIRNSLSVMVGLKGYFDSIDLPEVTIKEVYESKTNNMSEAKLKCAKEPKKAKNLTVGNEYEGIFVSKDGDQVDSFKEADYFLCTNNSGNEARYSISLFEEVVVVPPVPPIMPFAEYSNGEKLRISINRGEVTLFIADPREVDFVQLGNRLGHAGVNISCGISQIHGIQGTFASIKEILGGIAEEYYDDNVSEEELDRVAGDLLVTAIKRILRECNTRFGLVSTNEDTPGVVAQLTRFSEATTSGVNDNSRNTIHVFVINKD